MALYQPRPQQGLDNLAKNPYAPMVSMLSYSFFSISITLFNKALSSTYGFDSMITLTFLQGLVTVLSLQYMKWRGWVSYPDFNVKTAMAVLPLSIVFVSYVVISLISLGKVNLPMFTALRRLTILFVMAEEYFYFGTVPSRPIVNSVVVMTLGAAIAAWKDLSFDLVSYFWLFLTNLTTSLYTVYINVVKKQNPQLNVFGMMFYTSVTTLPAVFLLAWVTGDWGRAVSFKRFWDLGFQVCFQASIFVAFVMNVSTYLCTTLNSARTQTVIGQLKNIVPFALGLVLFDDYRYDHINFLGLVVGFWGGIQYSWVTYRDKADKAMVSAVNAVGTGATAAKLELPTGAKGSAGLSGGAAALTDGVGTSAGGSTGVPHVAGLSGLEAGDALRGRHVTGGSEGAAGPSAGSDEPPASLAGRLLPISSQRGNVKSL